MSRIIESLDYFPAGYCSSYSGLLFKGLKNQKMIFPAGVFLIKHRDQGYILYDTGYHLRIKQQLRYLPYRLGTPVQMTADDQIDVLLQKRGIQPEEIRYVVLSHLHPDHLGGAALFPKAQFMISQDVYQVYQKPSLKDLIFKEFLPSDFEDRLTILQPADYHAAFPYRPTLDLFGDGSILVASVDGHAKGQACLYLSELELLLAADLCWGIDLLPYTSQMRFLPSLVQDSKDDYLMGAGLLEQVIEDQIQVLVSHDPAERIERILDEKNCLSKKLH